MIIEGGLRLPTLWRPAGVSEHGGPACCVLRPCSSLLYPNAEAIHDEALRLALARGMPVVLDLSAAPFLDADGAEAMRGLASACDAAGTPLVFAEAASSVLEKLTAAALRCQSAYHNRTDTRTHQQTPKPPLNHAATV